MQQKLLRSSKKEKKNNPQSRTEKYSSFFHLAGLVVRDWTADPKAPGWSPAFSLYFFYFFRLKKCFQLCGFIHYFLPFLRKKNPKKKHGVWILDGAGSFFLSLTLIKWDPVVAPSWGKANKSASVAGSCNGAMPNWTLRTPIALCLMRRTEWTQLQDTLQCLNVKTNRSKEVWWCK